ACTGRMSTKTSAPKACSTECPLIVPTAQAEITRGRLTGQCSRHVPAAVRASGVARRAVERLAGAYPGLLLEQLARQLVRRLTSEQSHRRFGEPGWRRRRHCVDRLIAPSSLRAGAKPKG